CICIDEKGKIEDVNLTAAGLIGYSENEILNKEFFTFLLKNEADRFSRLLKLSEKNSEPLSGEFKINTSTGVLIIYLISVPFQHKKYQKTFYKLFFNDITEKKKYKKIIDESEKRFRLMADNSPVMIWMTDADNNLEYMNITKLDFLGKNLNELTNEGWLDTRHPEDKDRFLKSLVESAAERKNFSIEIRVKDRNGEFRWLLDSAAPRFSEDGLFAGFIGSGIDVTEEKNFRTNLQKSLMEKEVLLTEIHHRVKNNLQIISSLLSLQSSNIKDENIVSMFQTSKDRIRSMAILHEKLYQSNDIHEVNLKEYLYELLSYLIESYSQSSKIKLNLEVSDIKMNIEYCLTLGLIINELVSNSLKHAFKEKKEGIITVELNKNENAQLMLTVMDNGVGMPKNYNLHESSTLGLMLVRTLVEQHAGSMEIHQNGRTEFQIQMKYDEEEIN
ncbi:MAG: PAS domain S-box protein, partial [Ignavibacteriales bacterium]